MSRAAFRVSNTMANTSTPVAANRRESMAQTSSPVAVRRSPPQEGEEGHQQWRDRQKAAARLSQNLQRSLRLHKIEAAARSVGHYDRRVMLKMLVAESFNFNAKRDRIQHPSSGGASIKPDQTNTEIQQEQNAAPLDGKPQQHQQQARRSPPPRTVRAYEELLQDIDVIAGMTLGWKASAPADLRTPAKFFWDHVIGELSHSGLW